MENGNYKYYFGATPKPTKKIALSLVCYYALIKESEGRGIQVNSIHGKNQFYKHSTTAFVSYTHPSSRLNSHAQQYLNGQKIPLACREKGLYLPLFQRTTKRLFLSNDNKNEIIDDDETTIKGEKKKGGFLNFDMFNMYESEIPESIRDEIYYAESQTPAAKDRNTRVTLYAVLAVLGLLFAFFNVFVSDLKNNVDPEMPSIDEAGFAWVLSNPITSFFFSNKIGGLICLLVGAGSGLLAEAELDTKRINSEKIFQELKRRKDLKENNQGTANKVTKKNKKRKASGKESKRITALSEVIDVNQSVKDADMVIPETTDSTPQSSPETTISSTKDNGIGGIFNTVKNFYDKADSLAASQALLLNKKLEEQGILEKITDETGLKVIGKEKAAELSTQNKDEKNSKVE